MRRTGNLFDKVLDRENLRQAFSKALRGKRSRSDARAFGNNLDFRLAEMAQQLATQTFPVGRFHQFVIHDPKERIITAPCFAERVLHHAVMNVCEPIFERWLISDTYACRRGRGRVVAIHRACQFARRHPFFLKLDIRKYFDSVSHSILREKLSRLFKDELLLNLLDRIIDGFRGDLGRGLPIGSLTSQHLANFYLGWFDRFVKESMRVRGYVRYMDDMILWGESARELTTALDNSRKFLNDKLQLEFKPTPFINRTQHGLDFLGGRIFASHFTLNRRSRVRSVRSVTRLERLFDQGHIDERELQRRATSLFAFMQAGGCSSWQFRRRLLQGTSVDGQ